MIPHGLKRLLGLNLNFCPNPRHPITSTTLIQAAEDFKRSIRIRFQFSKNKHRSYNKKLYVPNLNFTPGLAPTPIESIFHKIDQNLASYSCVPSRTKRRNLNKGQRRLLTELKLRKDLKVVISDKNLGPTLFTRKDYVSMCLNHLKSVHYKDVTSIPLKALQLKLLSAAKNFHKLLVATNFHKDAGIIVHELESKSINLFYALAKIHKPNLSIRPIVSNCRGILSGLSKWLDYHLQPYCRRLRSYVRDSNHFLTDLHNVTVQPGDIMFTYDITSLYTNIETKRALTILQEFLPQTTFTRLLLRGLQIIMENNYFSFGDTQWKQMKGTAMGTSCAPCFATLYLGAIEEKLFQSGSSPRFYRRFIDDGFGIWNNPKPFSLNNFMARLRRDSKLQFETQICTTEACFLDVVIRKESKYETKTHQKALNLFLYLPKHSAHPPGILKSLIYGRIMVFHKQNSKKEDFLYFSRMLLIRLIQRGYKIDILLPIFKDAFAQIQQDPLIAPRKRNVEQVHLKLPYDPNGLTSKQIRTMFEVEALTPYLQERGIQRVILCYKRPPNLRQSLCPSKLQDSNDSSPAARNSTRAGEGTPNPYNHYEVPNVTHGQPSPSPGHTDNRTSRQEFEHTDDCTNLQELEHTDSCANKRKRTDSSSTCRDPEPTDSLIQKRKRTDDTSSYQETEHTEASTALTVRTHRLLYARNKEIRNPRAPTSGRILTKF
jgi:hypothetical protein